MFGFLKKKISNVIENISKKKEEEEKFEEQIEKIEEKIEKEPEKIIEEIEKIGVKNFVEQETRIEEPKIEDVSERSIQEIFVEEKIEILPESTIENSEVQKIEMVKKEIENIFKEEKIEIIPETKPPVIESFAKEEIKKLEEEIKQVPKQEKISLFKKVIKKITEKKLAEEDIAPLLNELENGLIESDVAYETALKVKTDLKDSLLNSEVKRSEVRDFVIDVMKRSLMDVLNVPDVDLEENVKSKKPYTILFIGFNGAGKTTTLAKVGNWLKDRNYSCVFAAADTFRAASLEQLEEHGDRIGIDVIKHDYGADPAAVVYDAIEHAKAKGKHFVLADSAGRIHTNKDLLDEMKKIIRVNKPDLKVLVIDSMTGNDALLQARVFNEIGVDAVIFTKVDVNEKGGSILSVTHEIKKPILFLCNGQEYDKMISFNAKEFVDNLVGV